MRLRESVARETRTPRLSDGRWPALRRLGAPPPTRRISHFEILEARGIKVVLVNAHHLRHERGRKSDVSDSDAHPLVAHASGCGSPPYPALAGAAVLEPTASALRDR